MRALNRVLAVVIALLLLAAVVVVGAEIVLGLLGQPPWLLPEDRLAGFGQSTTWSSSAAITTGVVLVLLGLLLLLLELRRGKPSAIELATDVPALTLSAHRRSLEHLLRRSAEREPGVDSASVRVGDRRATVRASTYLKDTGDLSERVRRAVEERLQVLQLRRAARVKVDIELKERR
jgi:hypothetical protein